MGWCKSPPFFCAGSETARDIIYDLLKGNTTLPWHKFEKVMISNSMHSTIPGKPVNIIEVFVNDFICATNIYDLTHLLYLLHCMLHGNDTINPPLWSHSTQRGRLIIRKEAKQRERNMGAQEMNPRLDLQWTELYTAPTSGKNRKILDRLQNIKRFTTKTPRKVINKLTGSL